MDQRRIAGNHPGSPWFAVGRHSPRRLIAGCRSAAREPLGVLETPSLNPARYSTPAHGLSKQVTLDDPVNERTSGNAGKAAASITRRVSGPSVKQTAGHGAS
jgi:hypothetical protein